jgi:hypothetical protein
LTEPRGVIFLWDLLQVKSSCSWRRKRFLLPRRREASELSSGFLGLWDRQQHENRKQDLTPVAQAGYRVCIPVVAVAVPFGKSLPVYTI